MIKIREGNKMRNTKYIFFFFLLLCACNNHQELDNRDIINLFVDSTPVQKNLSEMYYQIIEARL